VSTDLERFLATDGRAEAVQRVRAEIDAKGITYIYYQFASVTGRIMGKGAPADHWERMAQNGFQLVYGSTANLFIDRHGNYIGYGPEASELVGLPDVETFCQLPWDPKTARVFCTLFRNREEETDPGGFLTSDCRGNLRRIHTEFERETGLHMRVGTEPEMMWLKTKPDGTPSVDGMTKPYCYHIDQFSELQPVIHKVMEYSKAMGLDMIQGDHEDAPGQLELNWMFDRAEATADRLTTYRQICRQVGRELGVFPCFMPKPFTGVSANGHHHHFTLVDDEGNNVFHDPSGPAQLSDMARHFLGGMLDHFGALMCVGNPTVNSYCRMWDFGFWAPVYKNWGWQNRTCTVRVASGGRFEYRGVDSSCNPFLTVAALLVAGLDGIKRELDPGEPQSANTYDLLQEANGKQPLERVPDSLGDALAALAKDEVLRDGAMPGRLWQVFHHYKRDEWERYLAAVTDWERDEYLEVLP
jgi:glutamine synthetase